MSKLIAPFQLNDVSQHRNYTIDVRLFTYSTANFNPTPKEFTGINTLSVDYFKDNIGFGITNIDISINASLQPIVEITFKDLYGDTVFSRNNESPVDFSDIFDWPPPKFDLVYKGYLGKPTRLMLNLKKTDIQFNSTDGSFTIKCYFVPNTWGPFADIPALFLYAVKKLKIDESVGDANKIFTFFDLIKIGRKVDTVRKSFNNQYSDLKDKINQTRSSLYIAYTTGGLNPGYEIKGVVPSTGQAIPGFNNINIYDYTSDFKTIKDLKTTGINSTLLSDYFLSKTKISGSDDYKGTLESFVTYRSPRPLTGTTNEEYGTQNTNIVTLLNKKRELIDKNLQIIDEVSNAQAFSENQKEIEATTISKLFQSLAGDTGYLLGRILRAGIAGYENNSSVRDSNQSDLIGKFYPLMIQKRDSVENIGAENVQTIANQEYFKNLSVKNEALKNENEFIFVNNFINSIAFGLGDSASLEEPLDTKGRRQLVKRISNLEVLQSNPYYPSYNSIIENMVVRSGIYSHFTNSADPNTPGDYFRVTLSNREQPEDAAKHEMENLTDALIKELPIDDITRLKSSLLYFKRAFNPDNNVLSNIITSGNANSTFFINSDTVFEVNDEIKLNFKNVVNGVNLLDKGIPEDFGSSNLVYNNNLFWYNIPKKYKYVVFTSREQVEFIRQVNSAVDDSKYKGSPEQDDSGTIFGDEEPPGLIIIDGFAKNDAAGAGKIKYFNTFLENEQVVSYDKLVQEQQRVFETGDVFNYQNILATSELKITENSDSYPIAYCIYSANDDLVDKMTAWNLFGFGNLAFLQRTFLYSLSSELLIKLEKISDEKKLQIGTIQAKANEQIFSIYNQMHHIFYQWSSLIFNFTTENASTPNNNQNLYDVISLPQSLESLYKETGTENSNTQSGFQYLAPLIRYNGKSNPIDVENSIINLESCYSIDANTTVLNVIQNVCNKNNFLFFPLPGGNIYDVEEMFTPQSIMSIPRPGNKFIILWSPTPESRAKDNNGNDLGFIQDKNKIDNIPGFVVQFGSTDNAVFKNVRVGTDSTKTTAESIVNLQRLVDKQVDNKVVIIDCSTISLLEGRSYTCEIDTLGNAQISPMQFFFVDNMPIFGGLYQIMEVNHSITPNNFETKFRGIKMRYSAGNKEYGGIPPVTVNTSKSLSEKYKITATTSNDFANSAVSVGYDDPKSILNNPPVEVTDQFDTKSVSALKQNYQNGRIPIDALSDSVAFRTYYSGADKRPIKYKLYKEAAQSFDSLMNYFAKSSFTGKQPLSITDGYRDYDEQVRLKAKLGNQAATPGKSNHGWGVAVDFWWGIPTNLRKQEQYRQIAFTHPMYKWFFDNAWKFGWYNPATLRDNISLDEWWHWEFVGSQGAPKIISSLYDANFDFNKYPSLIKNSGGFFRA